MSGFCSYPALARLRSSKASALTTMVGFGVLVAAPLPAVGQLGFLTALTVALSFLVSLLVLPALLVLAERFFLPSAPVRQGSTRPAGPTVTAPDVTA